MTETKGRWFDRKFKRTWGVWLYRYPRKEISLHLMKVSDLGV